MTVLCMTSSQERCTYGVFVLSVLVALIFFHSLLALVGPSGSPDTEMSVRAAVLEAAEAVAQWATACRRRVASAAGGGASQAWNLQYTVVRPHFFFTGSWLLLSLL